MSGWPPAGPVRPRLEVDLGAIAANWRRLRDLAAPAAVGAVVKADAYGLGMAAAAPALVAAGARDLFVARPDEALALRALVPGSAAGVRIWLLDGLASGGAADLARAGVRPVLNQPGEVAAWRAHARALGRPLPAALHLDTGLWRLGLRPAELAALADAPGGLSGVRAELLLSHLACGDEPEHPSNARQLEAVAAARARWPVLPASLAASAGILLGPAYRLDLCRPGIALWGGNPIPGRPNPMRPVVRVTAPILQVHAVDAPGTVGYGATRPTRPGARLATVAAGYADGLLRAAGGSASARLAGIDIPFAGRVSMDLATLDVTAVPEAQARPGAEVELVGGADGIDRLAAAAGTIAYEVLTRLGPRLERRYLGGGDPAAR